jgi:hypothetical protein
LCSPRTFFVNNVLSYAMQNRYVTLKNMLC